MRAERARSTSSCSLSTATRAGAGHARRRPSPRAPPRAPDRAVPARCRRRAMAPWDNSRVARVGSWLVKFGVHTGLQNTTTQRAAARSGSTSRATDSSGSRSGTTSTRPTRRSRPRGSSRARRVPRSGHRAHRARDEHVDACGVGSLVYCVGYRHPAVLANAIATLDQLARRPGHARARRRMAPGASTTPTASRSRPRRCACARSTRRSSASALLLTEEVADFDGEFFQLRDARCEPKPVQARLPLWLGGGGEKVTLKHRRPARRRLERAVRGARASTRTRCRCCSDHCEAVGRDPARDRAHREPRVWRGTTRTSRRSSAASRTRCVRTCSWAARRR